MSDNLVELTKLLSQLDREKQIHRLKYYQPYPKQIEFHNARGLNGLPAAQKLFMAANQVGKTRCGAAEVAIHATGLYPSWWDGIRFPVGVKILVAGVTNELLRDKPQAELMGPPESEKDLGTGMIPIDRIVKVTKKAGVPNALDSVTVKHLSGRNSRIFFRPYEAGAKKFQSVDYDVVWLDEEPPQDIWSQCQRSTFAKNTYVALITATPETGMTEVVTQFMNDLAKNQALIGATWDDAPHMSPEMKEEKLRTIPLHERAMRTQGIPLQGAGLVFPYPDEDLIEEPIPIPRHWPQIIGIDFGYDHPFGGANVAWDRESDTVHITAVYRSTKELPLIHCVSIKKWGDWKPVAWPHDGLGTEKGTGKQLIVRYREGGLKLLQAHATNPPEPGQDEGKGGISPEAALLDMCTRMETNRFKVFSTCKEWFEEKRMYHRDQKGQLVKLRDDVISASRHAIMMLRFARVQTQPVKPRNPFHGLRNWGVRAIG